MFVYLLFVYSLININYNSNIFFIMHKAIYQQLSYLLSDEQVKIAIDPSLHQRALTLLNNSKNQQPLKSSNMIENIKTSNQINKKGTPNVEKQGSKFNNTKKLKSSVSHKTLIMSMHDDGIITQDTRTSTLKRPYYASRTKKNLNNISLLLNNKQNKKDEKQINTSEVFNTQQQNQQINGHCKLGNEFEYLSMIAQKQRQLKMEKQYYQNRASQLKKLIEKEKNCLGQITKSTIVLQQQLEKNLKKYQGQHNSTLLKRKLENIFHQVKNINNSYEELQEQNSKVKLSINQEKQLIGMYKTVIEQLKSQMRVEKSSYEKIKKQMLVLRKNENATKMKYQATNQDVQDVVGIIKDSFEKWK